MSAVKSVSWTALGQGMAALGVLLGQRWITELVSPHIYGEMALLVGIAGLAVNVFCTPFTQAALHEFPACQATGSVLGLKHALAAQLSSVLLWVIVAVVVAGLIATSFGVDHVAAALLAMILFLTDSWRSAALAMTNAGEQHSWHALWTVADAWLRALVAVLAVLAFGPSTEMVIAAYVVATLLLLPCSQRVLPMRRKDGVDDLLRKRIFSYALPLVPLGVIGWVTGLADRYVIGSTLSVADVGIYAAAAGLASRPMLMLGTSIELVMRPRYQRAVSNGDYFHERKIVMIWLGAILGIGFLVVTFIGLCHEYIAAWLLGDQFRSGSYLMPWIAGGYWMLVVSYVFERICYAHGNTKRVLAIQVCTASVAVICLMIGARCYGLVGAAMSVPVYYLVQLLVSIFQANQSSRNHHSLFGRAHA